MIGPTIPGPMWPDVLIERLAAVDLDAGGLAARLTADGAPTTASAVREWLRGGRPGLDRWGHLVRVLLVSPAEEARWLEAVRHRRRDGGAR